MSAFDPTRKPGLPVVAAGYWGAPVAGLVLPTAASAGRRAAGLVASSIGASSAELVAKLGFRVWPDSADSPVMRSRQLGLRPAT
jgi:hypothetical protein